jgi:hypothetical protein
MQWWPGWDSIDWTDFWNTFYFWAGIVCLFLLGTSEVVSHYYGERHSALVAAASSRKADEQQKENAHRDQEVIAARNAAKSANDQLAKMREQQAPRRLTPQQQQMLIKAISPFRGQKIAIWAVASDTESKDFAYDFIPIVREAGWDYGGGITQVQPGSKNPVGMAILMNDVERSTSGISDAAGTLIVSLFNLNILPDKTIRIDSGVAAGTILLYVGVKPPPK